MAPLSEVNLPRQIWFLLQPCSTLHDQRASPSGRFPPIPNQLEACWVTPVRLWQRTGGWAGQRGDLDGFPSSSLCRGLASRGSSPLRFSWPLGSLSLHPAGRDGFLLLLISDGFTSPIWPCGSLSTYNNSLDLILRKILCFWLDPEWFSAQSYSC